MIVLFNGSNGIGFPRRGSKFKRLDIKTKTTTKKALIDQYISDLEQMSFHLFSCNWNYAMFLHCKDNLYPGELLQVLDFGQNYMNIYQDEPQGVHWDPQSDGNRKLVMEEHIMMTDDLKHNKICSMCIQMSNTGAFEEERLCPNQNNSIL